jgi:hypothetical protein
MSRRGTTIGRVKKYEKNDGRRGKGEMDKGTK